MTSCISRTLRVCIALFACSLFGAPPQTVTILHTNDLHQAIRQVPRIAGYAAVYRKEHPNTVFVDAGDWFDRGSSLPMVTRGEAMYGALGRSGYDVWIMGNHDWAYGGERLRELMRRYPVPVLGSNLGTAKPPQAANVVDTLVREFDGLRIGFFGLTTDTYGIKQKGRPYIHVLDCRESAAKAIAELKAKKVDLIVAVTHLGFEKMKHESESKSPSDLDLVREFPDIDVIVGGHSHTRVEPERVRKVYEETGTIVVQAGASGQYVGELVLRIDPETRRIVGFESSLVPVTDAMSELPDVAAFVAAQYARYMPGAPTVVAHLAEDVERHNVGLWYAGFLRERTGADAVLLPVRAFNKEPKALPKGTLDEERFRAHFRNWRLIRMDVRGNDLLAYCQRADLVHRFHPLHDRGRPYSEDAIFTSGFTVRFDADSATVVFDIDENRVYSLVTPWCHSWRDLPAAQDDELPSLAAAAAAMPLGGLKTQGTSVLDHSTVDLLLDAAREHPLEILRVCREPRPDWDPWQKYYEALPSGTR